jgi:hypothetical protein
MIATLNKVDHRSTTPQAFVCPCGEENPTGMGDVRCGCGAEYNRFGQNLAFSWEWDTTGKAADTEHERFSSLAEEQAKYRPNRGEPLEMIITSALVLDRKMKRLLEEKRKTMVYELPPASSIPTVVVPTNINAAQDVIDGYENLLLTGQLDREHAGPEYYGGDTEYGHGGYDYSIWTAHEGRDLGNGDLPADHEDELPVLVKIEGLGLFTAEEIK